MRATNARLPGSQPDDPNAREAVGLGAAVLGDTPEALALEALARPRWMQLWLAFARRLSWVMSSVVLTLVYFLLLAPFSLLAGAWRVGWQRSEASSLERPF